jgi:hypothetical protein
MTKKREKWQKSLAAPKAFTRRRGQYNPERYRRLREAGEWLNPSYNPTAEIAPVTLPKLKFMESDDSATLEAPSGAGIKHTAEHSR